MRDWYSEIRPVTRGHVVELNEHMLDPERNPHFRVMATRGHDFPERLYREYLQSPDWQVKRQAVMFQWGNCCALCCSFKDIHVHHRTYERIGRELPTDLIPLCDECHKTFHMQKLNGDEPISAPGAF